MKYKKLMLVTFLLLAILTIGAVSASEDISSVEDVSQDDALAVENTQEDLNLNHSEENIAGDDAQDVLSYDASDFNAEINESMDLADEGAAVTFDVPSGAGGEIRVITNYTSYTLGFDLEFFEDTQLTLEDLHIYSAGKYFINVTFLSGDDVETPLTSGTIDVTGTVSLRDFNGKISQTEYTTDIDDEIFKVEGSPADGTIIVFVDGTKQYSKSASADEDISISTSNLDFYGINGEYNIVVKFNTTAGKAFTLKAFDLYYNVDSFYGKKAYSDYTTVTDTEIFEIEDCPFDGNLLVYVDGNLEFNSYVPQGGDISVYDSNLSFYGEKGTYELSFDFNTTKGIVFNIIGFDFDYDIDTTPSGSEPYIDLPNKVDFRSYLVYLAYISDKNNVSGTVTLSIDGKEFYNKELTGTQDYLFIKDTDLKGFDIGDFLGNHTVKLTYNNIIKQSDVSFVFEPYFIAPYELAVGESSCIVFKATSKSKGSVKLYNTVHNESNDTYSQGTLIGTYSINGASTVVPLPVLKTVGYNVFYMNYTIDGISDAGMIGIKGSENSNQFTSTISASVIGVGDSVTLTVTGPKAGGIDFIRDATPIKYYSLKNGTVQHTFSNLTIGKHIIGVSFDGLDESDLFYSNSFTITVTNESVPKQTDISTVNVALSKTAFTYNAKVQKPTVTLSNGAVLKEGVDYTLKWSAASPKNVGTYSVTVTGIGTYNGTVKATFKINKAANPLAVKAKTANVKFSAVKKKAQTLAVSKVVTFTKKGQGTLTYAKSSGNKKITINKKTGKVTVAKGLKKGTYKVKVKIKAAGNANYKASAYKTVTFKIVIK